MNVKQFLYCCLFFIVSLDAIAQMGLNFQGVARNASNAVLANQTISLRLSILQGNATGTVEFSEVRKVNTNAQGLFNAVIGDSGATSVTGDFSTINWKNIPKYLKIELDPAAGTNFSLMGTTQFQFVAYAQFANSVDATGIKGIVPAEKGGTGVTSISELKAVMLLDKSLALKADVSKVDSGLALKANISKVDSGLATKIDKITGKGLSTNDFTTIEKAKLAGISGINTGDQDLRAYATTSDLALKADASAVTAGLLLKENSANKSTASDLGGLTPNDILFPTQKAVKAYVDANSAAGGVSDLGITNIKLAELAVTDSKVAPGISKTKVGLGNVENTALSTWSGTNSLTTLGTVTSGAWGGTAIDVSNGGTGATTAAAARANLGLAIGLNVQAPLTAGTDYLTPNTTITSSTKTKLSYDSKGLIIAGSDATTADIAPSTNRNYVTDAQKVGILSNTSGINTGDQTITLTGDVTGAGTSSFSTTVNSVGGVSSSTISNFNTRINANTTSITSISSNFSNVENTALSTWSGTNNLITLGSITSGVWGGTAIAISKGGTGATTAAAARSNLGLDIGLNVQAPLTAGTDYITPNSTIAGATKTKITFDSKGLITAGADATTADIAPSVDRNYVTDAQKAGVLSNTSGINTGDQVLPTLASLGAVPANRSITINGTSLDLSADRTYSISTGLTVNDLESVNVKAKTFELTQPSSINSSSTTTLNLSSGNILEVVLTSSTTLAFSNPKIGTYLIKIKQDATGNRVLTFPTIKWADAAIPTITTSPNATDLITLIYDGVDYYGSCLQNF